MQTNISEHSNHIVIAGEGNNLNRYKVSGDKIAEIFAKFSRVVYIGLLEGFEIYVKNPQTGGKGWDIVWVEGVRECIEKHYPHFDTIITKDYPSGNELVKFYNIEHEDYPLVAFTTDGKDKMTEERISDLFDTLIDSDVHTTIDYIISKDKSRTSEELLEMYDNQ